MEEDKELKVTDLRIGDYVGLKSNFGLFAYEVIGIQLKNANSTTDATLTLVDRAGENRVFSVKLDEAMWVRTLPRMYDGEKKIKGDRLEDWR